MCCGLTGLDQCSSVMCRLPVPRRGQEARRGRDTGEQRQSPRRQRDARPLRPRTADRRQPDPAEAYEPLAAELDLAPTVLALAWLLSRPGVTAPVLGPRTLDQLTGSFPALNVTLESHTLTQLDELFIGPGEAPDAYTW
jgi:aryl-alcohol dehydrogenase-like predicted oxidoreductase